MRAFTHGVHAHHAHAQLFKVVVQQYDRLRKRKAFLDTYQKEARFAETLDEFDDARQGLDYGSLHTSKDVL